MGFISDLFSGLFRSKSGKDHYTLRDGPQAIKIFFECSKCGEKIPVRLSTTSELQRREGPDAELGPGAFFVQKTVVGNKCYQRIEAVVDFDAKYRVAESKISGGRLLTVQEFEKQEKDES